jgi:hypothetical protein
MSGNIAPVAAGQVFLNDLVARIRNAHISVISAISNAVQHALAAGKALNTAKSSKKVPHGKWLAFLEHCDIDERTAQRYMQLAKLADPNPSCTTDLAGLSIEAAIERLSPPKPPKHTPTGQQAPERGERGKPVKRPTCAKTKHVDIIEVWIAAPATERTRALDGIGLELLLAAIPPAWWPLIERHLAERQKPPIPTVTVTAAIPDDLSIPPLLKRAPAAALLKVGASI